VILIRNSTSTVGHNNGIEHSMDILKSTRTAFSQSYSEAQYKFISAAENNGLQISSYKNPYLGPLGEELVCNTAWAGSEKAKRVILILSATHGVEGFCGSGCQVDWLGCWSPERLTNDTAVLFVHAINPHGFAWCRRVTEEGCDLNRNFLDFDKPLPDNPGHDELVDAFVPNSLDSETILWAEEKIKRFRYKNGELNFQTARKAGQYKHPHSMFFGGFSPTWSRLTLEGIISDYSLTQTDFVAIVDFHTGLGPFGYGEPISGHRPNTPGYEWVSKVYGESVGVPELGTSSSIPLTGTSRDLWDRQLGERYAYIALEYGTYSQERSRVALREDHWLHNQGAVDWARPETQRIKMQLKQHYYPNTPDWLEMVLQRSRQILRQTTEAINITPNRQV